MPSYKVSPGAVRRALANEPRMAETMLKRPDEAMVRDVQIVTPHVPPSLILLTIAHETLLQRSAMLHSVLSLPRAHDGRNVCAALLRSLIVRCVVFHPVTQLDLQVHGDAVR